MSNPFYMLSFLRYFEGFKVCHFENILICLNNLNSCEISVSVLLYLFLSTFLVTTWYSMPLILITCPKKLHCLCIIFCVTCLSVWILFIIFSFVTLVIQEISTIFWKIQIYRSGRKNQEISLPSLQAWWLTIQLVRRCTYEFWTNISFYLQCF